MKIYVFSPSLATVGLVTNFDSLTHTRQLAGSGSFKLKAPFTPELYAILTEENILYWEDAGKVRAVYIDSVVCEQEADGETITASGKNLRAYLGRRIVWSNFSFTGTVEDFVRRLVTENAVNPTDTARKIPLLSLAPRLGLAETITTATENENLEELLDDLSTTYGLGFDILLDPKARALQFSVYEGTDRRTTQKATPWVVVSRDRNNVVSEVFTRSTATARNTALISGFTDEETGARHEKEILAGSGLSRRELFVKGSATRPKPDEEAGETEAVAMARYDEELLQKGREKLANQVNTLSLEAEISPDTVARLEVGDKVTAIEKRYGLTSQTFISEITAYYERGGTSYDATLGDAVPTVNEKLKKEIV